MIIRIDRRDTVPAGIRGLVLRNSDDEVTLIVRACDPAVRHTYRAAAQRGWLTAPAAAAVPVRAARRHPRWLSLIAAAATTGIVMTIPAGTPAQRPPAPVRAVHRRHERDHSMLMRDAQDLVAGRRTG